MLSNLHALALTLVWSLSYVSAQQTTGSPVFAACVDSTYAISSPLDIPNEASANSCAVSVCLLSSPVQSLLLMMGHLVLFRLVAPSASPINGKRQTLIFWTVNVNRKLVLAATTITSTPSTKNPLPPARALSLVHRRRIGRLEQMQTAIANNSSTQ